MPKNGSENNTNLFPLRNCERALGYRRRSGVLMLLLLLMLMLMLMLCQVQSLAQLLRD
jgi:hypothetical protein